jgi:hypothetical protein
MAEDRMTDFEQSKQKKEQKPAKSVIFLSLHVTKNIICILNKVFSDKLLFYR